MTNTKVALITGITGQDGAFLAELLLGKGYIVHGIKRRSSSFNSERIDHLYQDRHGEDVRFFLHYGDFTDTSNLIRIIQECQPAEIYNLAAQRPARPELQSAGSSRRAARPASVGSPVDSGGRHFRPSSCAVALKRDRRRDRTGNFPPRKALKTHKTRKNLDFARGRGGPLRAAPAPSLPPEPARAYATPSATLDRSARLRSFGSRTVLRRRIDFGVTSTSSSSWI
jgi:hypothetical protein